MLRMTDLSKPERTPENARRSVWEHERPATRTRRLEELGGILSGYGGILAERFLSGPPGYETVGWADVVGDLDERFGGVRGILEERALGEAEERARRLLGEIRGEDPFVPRWAADSLTARFCYLACRLLEPEVVVETGVAYGVSSSFILKALSENGRGRLYSVDLPPLRRRYGRYWGIAVDEATKDGWTLLRGSSRRVLPRLLEEVDSVGLFVHDSLHTSRNMRREFETVWPRLKEGGMVVADDVERNGAFGDLLALRPALWHVVRDRERIPLHGNAAPVVFGVAVK